MTNRPVAEFIGPCQKPVMAPRHLNLGSYFMSSSTVVFDRNLSKRQLADLPFHSLPLAVSSKHPVRSTALAELQRAVDWMSEGKWDAVYTPSKPGFGNNSGNGMTGIFLQRADMQVNVQLDPGGNIKTRYFWPKIRKYSSRKRISPQNYNYSLAYHYFRKPFESAFDLLIDTTVKLDQGFLEVLLSRKKVGLYFGLTDYYGDPDSLPGHLYNQVLQENPNPDAVFPSEYLNLLRQYRENPILPGNYHTDGVEKVLDVQGIFTICNRDVLGGKTLIRRKGLRRHRRQLGLRPLEYDITVELDTPEGYAGLWVPSWGRTAVEHTPGPIQGGHRSIIVFALDSADASWDVDEKSLRKFYGPHHETLSWDRRSWFPGEKPIMKPDLRLWRI